MLTISKGVSLMKIALIAHDRKPMMVKLATAYKTILEKHELLLPGRLGRGSRKQPACRSIGLNPDR